MAEVHKRLIDVFVEQLEHANNTRLDHWEHMYVDDDGNSILLDGVMTKAQFEVVLMTTMAQWTIIYNDVIAQVFSDEEEQLKIRKRSMQIAAELLNSKYGAAYILDETFWSVEEREEVMRMAAGIKEKNDEQMAADPSGPEGDVR